MYVSIWGKDPIEEDETDCGILRDRIGYGPALSN